MTKKQIALKALQYKDCWSYTGDRLLEGILFFWLSSDIYNFRQDTLCREQLIWSTSEDTLTKKRNAVISTASSSSAELCQARCHLVVRWSYILFAWTSLKTQALDHGRFPLMPPKFLFFFFVFFFNSAFWRGRVQREAAGRRREGA